jgi:hypothetical protein
MKKGQFTEMPMIGIRKAVESTDRFRFCQAHYLLRPDFSSFLLNKTEGRLGGHSCFTFQR